MDQWLLELVCQNEPWSEPNSSTAHLLVNILLGLQPAVLVMYLSRSPLLLTVGSLNALISEGIGKESVLP